MKEIERIINQNILPESFFQEETRDGFVVTESRKKLWGILLDLLLKFDEVCKNNDLRYFLSCGSMLGAVRHKGFIPWDDDIDVCMPREDYDRLLTLSDEFRSPYFLQTPYTDKNSAYSFAKLRNSNTTQASKNFIFQDFNHGILMDIFPLDKWDSSDKIAFDTIKYLALENSTYMRKENPILSEYDRRRVKIWSGIDSLTIFEIIQKIAKKYSNVETDCVAIAVCSLLKYENNLCQIDDFSDSVMEYFEGYEFPVPCGYDRVLKNYYGDYMEFPPMEKRGVWHSDLLIDVDTPFDEYVNNYRRDVVTYVSVKSEAY